MRIAELSDLTVTPYVSEFESLLLSVLSAAHCHLGVLFS